MVNRTGTPKEDKSKSRRKLELERLSKREEEILEYIWKLKEEGEIQAIKRLDIADILHCSPALVNKILAGLEKKSLIHHKKYGEIKLSEKGRRFAIALIRKHRLSEALFVNILGLEPSEAHDFACKFEHIMDDKLENRIEKLLNNPEACPHGNPIPSKNTQKILIRGKPLSSFAINNRIIISQILHEDTNFLRKLSQIGIKVGTQIKIIEKSPLDDTLVLEINNNVISLSEETAKRLLAILEEEG